MKTIKEQDLKVGEKYLVATYGIVTTWNETTFSHLKEETATTNRLLYFDGRKACYHVLSSEISKRVRQN